MLSLHFHLAGEHEPAWRHGRAAARRAADRCAFAAAAELWAARWTPRARSTCRSPSASTRWEQLGEARAHAGALSGADARRSGARAGSRPATSCARRAWCSARRTMHERAGRTVAAVRSAGRGCGCSTALAASRPPACAPGSSRRSARCASARGATREAARLCREAIAAAEAAGDELALARACFMLDWALVDLGRRNEAVLLRPRARDLQARRRPRPPGGRAQQPRHVRLLGRATGTRRSSSTSVRRRRACRAGDVANAAFGDCNIGEVLADQGHSRRPRRGCARARRVWRGTEDAHGVAFATTLLGRLAARAGRADEGLELLDDARARSCARSASRATRHWPTPTAPRRWRSAAGPREALALARRAAGRAAAPRRRCCGACARLARAPRRRRRRRARPRCARRSSRRARRARPTRRALALRALGELGVDRCRRRCASEGRTLLAALGVERVPALPSGRGLTSSSARADRRRRPAGPEGQRDSMMPSPEPVFLRFTTHGAPAFATSGPLTPGVAGSSSCAGRRSRAAGPCTRAPDRARARRRR